ncbi:hypothetical protein [Azorhizobium sp. AG788]|uniref:hypothetical protein n=1 Tax=Azorhizobium sp. AG788 TaxID=2183897 RepID=UPI00313A39D2
MTALITGFTRATATATATALRNGSADVAAPRPYGNAGATSPRAQAPDGERAAL